MPQLDPLKVVAITFITGFAIQQILQIFDSFGITQFIDKLKGDKDTVLGISPDNFKKSLMMLLASIFGIAVAFVVQIELLSYVLPDPDKIFDRLLSGLVVGSGTEASNTILKYFGYVKDAQKESIIEISIVPGTAAVLKGQTIQFTAIVKNNDNAAVEWKVLQSGVGTIDSTGLFSAQNIAGTFQILAVSRADIKKTAIANVTIQ